MEKLMKDVVIGTIVPFSEIASVTDWGRVKKVNLPRVSSVTRPMKLIKHHSVLQTQYRTGFEGAERRGGTCCSRWDCDEFSSDEERDAIALLRRREICIITIQSVDVCDSRKTASQPGTRRTLELLL
jgi:hypothetical protein